MKLELSSRARSAYADEDERAEDGAFVQTGEVVH